MVTSAKREGSGALVWSCSSGWKILMVETQINDRKYIMGDLWFQAKWSSGTLAILLVWSGLVGSGLALVWSCGKTNQSLPVFLMEVGVWIRGEMEDVGSLRKHQEESGSFWSSADSGR
jgi:hypothetical protein